MFIFFLECTSLSCILGLKLFFCYFMVKSPGMEEPQPLMFSPPDCVDVGSSPFTGMMDTSDQMILPVGFSSFESFNPPLALMDESLNKNQEVAKDALSSGSMNYTPVSSTGEFDYVIKSEALMTFAPEYGAVETSAGELSPSVFKSPYIPQSRKVESANSSTNNYIYSATPPSPCIDGSDEKLGVGLNLKARSGKHENNAILHSKNYYIHVESVKDKHDGGSLSCDNSIVSREDVPKSVLSGFNSANTIAKSPSHSKSFEGGVLAGGESSLLSTKTVIASELECTMFQAFMCRIRHTLLSSGISISAGSSVSRNTVSYQIHGDSNIMAENISNKYELKKKETIPVRIAGDIDVGLLDGPLNSPVGVWRSVGGPKGSKPMAPSMEAFPSLSHNTFNEETMLSYVQRQPLLELLNGMSLLVQQATSLVDLTLDADFGDGPYGWLALQEQWRRGFSCGPSMVHAGCGGVLASCHSLDVAGVELVDPLSADVSSYIFFLFQFYK